MQVVGQRLIDLGLFIEIQGGTQFVVSNTVYYQFCHPLRPKTSTVDIRAVRRYVLGIGLVLPIFCTQGMLILLNLVSKLSLLPHNNSMYDL